MDAPFTMNSFMGKQLLALVRQGNYAHAGEEEAIDLALAGLPKSADRLILDAGCGRGGTAYYMQGHGWGRVTGFDIEPRSIDSARRDYPDIEFQLCDIVGVSDMFDARFDAITMFNVLYALPDHASALKALAQVAKSGAKLVIFDYVDPGDYRSHAINEGDGPFLPNPVAATNLVPILEDAGWTSVRTTDITESYAGWYDVLVGKIDARRSDMEALAGSNGYYFVRDIYSRLRDTLRNGYLAGYIINAQKT